ncbi:MAG: hypothetical protein ACFFD4_24385 [Candidatus Odinarchaeota archaeon]
MADAMLVEIMRYYVSIIGIVGAFFYIQMGNWLQSIYKLGSKLEVSENVSRDEEIRLQNELSIEIGEYKNWVFFILMIIIDVIFFFLALLSIDIYASLGDTSSLYQVMFPYWLFTAVFICSSAVSLFVGYKKLYAIADALPELKSESESEE